MILSKLKLENFRNHLQLEQELGLLNVIIGRNGSGKSNILEAIFVLSSCRSFREEDKKNLVNFESAFARVSSGDLEVFIQKEPMLLLRSRERGVNRKQSDYIGLLKSVVFSPETISLIGGAPKQRRRFLDLMISQGNREYLRALIGYEKVRHERNSLLQQVAEGKSKANELDFWDNELVKFGQIILFERQNAIECLNKQLDSLYRTISGKETETLSIQYENSCTGEEMRTKIEKNRQREIWAGHSLFGPHRDDLIFLLNTYNVNNYASRGETKSVVLALKIAELNYLATDQAERPILLLDDLFSEFDEIRRGHLSEIMKDFQTVITTTDRAQFSKKLLNQSLIIEMS
ncbi:MAG: DNA replication and repair protein RecF [Candidatus Berkelbacteria bacterium]|nr:DNA replication and repair protein RecF [Candidatus Berkelbacteria bacterium]